MAVIATALVLGLATGTLADDAPDAAFLEYLGSWGDEGDEEEWIMLAGDEDGDPAELAELRESPNATRSEDDEVTYER